MHLSVLEFPRADGVIVIAISAATPRKQPDNATLSQFFDNL